jgi:hypothetical protein
MAQTPSRRRVLAGFGLLPVAFIPNPPAIAAAPGADGELLLLCRELTAVRTTIDSYNRGASASEAEWDAALDAWNEIVGKITDIPAKTPAGTKAKAEAARRVLKANLFGGSGPVLIQAEANEEDLLC